MDPNEQFPGTARFRTVQDALWRESRAARDFEALSKSFAAKGFHRLDYWPQSYRDVRSPLVEAFRREHPGLVEFHAWLQWLADEQLAAAAHKARESEMEMGLYGDLAVGADRSGLGSLGGTPNATPNGLVSAHRRINSARMVRTGAFRRSILCPNRETGSPAFARSSRRTCATLAQSV